MPYVPGCSHDLFVSYASENNRDGWVEQFVLALGQELSELLGSRHFNPKDSIFYDRRELQTAQSFPAELVSAARDSAILVPVLSRGYLLSPWCNRERIEFFAKLPHGSEASACLAPIVLRTVDESELDNLYRTVQRFSFLSPDGQTPLPANSPAWKAQVNVFAGQVRTALQKLRKCCRPVFLGKGAETERAQGLRTWCQTELERRHFRIVPESLPVLDDADGVRVNLQQSGLAIHFLGSADATALDAIDTSVAVCGGPTILYQPFGTDLTAAERLWLREFERDLQASPGAYQRLAGKNDQELIALIDEQITRIRTDGSPPETERPVSVVCDQEDLDGVRLLQEDLRGRGLPEIHSPDFLGGRMKAMERLRRWQDFLYRSRALLFYYGLTDRERLELIWQTARQQGADIRLDWFVAPPDLETKRQELPDALWNIDQVIRFMERGKCARQG